jgi:hypothetical protein
MPKSPTVRRTLPPLQVVFEPGYLSQPVVHQVYARLLPPTVPPPAPLPAPATSFAGGASAGGVPHGR